MTKMLAVLLLLRASAVWADDNTQGWQATLALHSISGQPLSAPVTIVPKQSIQMTATVWMPEKINWFPQYPDWDMPGAAITPQFMLSPSIERPQGSFTQRGATQNYLLTPLTVGTLSLSQHAIQVYPDKPDSPKLAVAPITVEVALPADYHGTLASFLPATALKLTQTLSLMTENGQDQTLNSDAPPALTLKKGQMLKRQILISAQGIQGAQIPEPTPDAAVTSHDTATTDLTNYDEFQGGTRTLTWYYAPGNGDHLSLQPLTIAWFDTAHAATRTATLRGYRFGNEAPAAVTPAVTLSFGERLSLISWQQWGCGIAALALLIILAVNARRLCRAVTRGMQRGKARAAASERYAFWRLTAALAGRGISSALTMRHYQRWRVMQADKGNDDPVIQAWLRARYGKPSTPPPSRSQLLLALHRQRRAMRETVRKPWFRAVSLPATSPVEKSR